MDERMCYIMSMFKRDQNISRHIKRGRDTKIPQSSGPLINVGDEAVHKELGDRMERAATTASSLEAEQDSGSGPRCQDTILGDVNAQTRFEITSKQFIDPPLSRGYALGSGEDSMKLIRIDEILYTTATAKVQTVNGVRQLQALVDKKRVIVTESSIRRDLHLDDAEGTDCLPTATIFEELACIAKVFANIKRAGKDFSRRITPLFDTMMVQPIEEMGKDSDHPTNSTQIHIIDQPSSSSQPKKDKQSKKAQRQAAEVPQDKAKVPQDEAEHEESVPTPSNDPQPSAKDAQAKEIVALKKRIQGLERRKMSRPTGLKRLRKAGMSRKVESSKDQESLGAPEDASKQERSIEDIDADVDDDVMHVEAKVDGKDKHSKKPDDSTAGEAVTIASIDDSAVPTTNEEITLAQTLIQIKAAKPKVVTTAATTATTTRPKD
ncbi:hypothetical protein Tco_1569944, partial [Tanacetum coccineum]